MIVKIKLDNSAQEILFTNLTKEEVTPQELKELCPTRMEIENKLRQIKKKQIK